MKYVKSNYAAPWTGVVLNQVKRGSGLGDLCLVLTTKDKNGNIPRKRILKIFDVFWLNEIKPFSLSEINPDWFTNLENTVHGRSFKNQLRW